MSFVGSVALDLALVLAGVAVLFALAGRALGQPSLITVARRAVYATAALVTVAVVVLLQLIFTDDFLVRMVHTSSATALPWYYKATLLWVDLDSSMLFWSWILALLSALAIHQYRDSLSDLIPVASAVLMVVLSFFVALVVFHRNPFDEYLVETPILGSGMKPQLRNPWMLVHPPAQYLGYIFTTIPFAFAVAALLRPTQEGRERSDWLRAIRPWLMTTWIFLGLGLVLGMIWAYELIDWGGWWSWDPVENAALIPWFTATALIHSALVQTRRGLLRGWTFFLTILTFWLTVLGTFFTRSGIVRSVHSFGEDKALFWSFIIFMGLGAATSFGLLIARQAGASRPERRIGSLISLEYAMVLANWLFFLSGLFVLTASIYPTLAEAIVGDRVTVGPPFYHRYMVPIGIALLALTAVAPLLPWQGISVRRLGEQLFGPFVAMVVALGLMAWIWPQYFPLWRTVRLGQSTYEVPGVNLIQLTFGLSTLVVAVVVKEWVGLARARARHAAETLGTALWRTLGANLRRYGAHAVHVGVALMFLGFAAKPLVQHGDRVLDPGDSYTVGGREVQFLGFAGKHGEEAQVEQAVLLVRRPGSVAAQALLPGTVSFYDRPQMPVSEVALARSLGSDLHVRYDHREGSRVSLKVSVHPFVSWLWIGFGVMVLGALLALSTGSQRRPAPPGTGDGAPSWLPLLQRGLLGAGALWAVGVGIWLALRFEPDQRVQALWAGAVALAVAGAAGACVHAILGLFAPVAPGAAVGLDERGAEEERLIQELRQLREAERTGKLSAEEHLALAREPRRALAVLLATRDAEAARATLAARLAAETKEVRA